MFPFGTAAKFLADHRYAFLEVNNIFGHVRAHNGDAAHCTNSIHEQHVDNLAFLANKNVNYPVYREMRAIEQSLVLHHYEKQIHGFGAPQSTDGGSAGQEGTMYLGCGCWPATNWFMISGGGSIQTSFVNRTFNYINLAAAYYNMYEAKSRYPHILGDTALWEPVDYLKVAAILIFRGSRGGTGHMNDWMIPMVYNALLGEATLGNEGTIAQPTMAANRTYRSNENLAALMQSVLVTRANNNFFAPDFPFSSEFGYDNTGEEGAYMHVKYFATNGTTAERLGKMTQTLSKTMAWLGKVPLWYYQATGRPMGGDWWMFQYSTGHQSQIMDDFFFSLADDSALMTGNIPRYQDNNQFSQDMWRMVYPNKMASFIYIQSGQPELHGPTGPVPDRNGILYNDNPMKDGLGILGSSWGALKPARPYDWSMEDANVGSQTDSPTVDFGFPYTESAESDWGLWSGLNSLSADIVPRDPHFGLTGWGARITDTGTTYRVTPMDGLHRKLNVVGDRFQAELLHDRYTQADIRKDYKGVTFELENVSGLAHKGAINLRMLQPGTYYVYLDNALQEVVEVPARTGAAVDAYGLARPVRFHYYATADDKQTLTIVREDIDTDDGTPSVRGVLLEPRNVRVRTGGTYNFEAEVSVRNDQGATLSRDINWSVNGTDSSIVNGVLTVGANESQSVLMVTATSRANGSFSATAIVDVYRITGVEITSDSSTLAKGKELKLDAQVVGTNLSKAEQGVDSWSLHGASSDRTVISVDAITGEATLVVAVAETANQLAIRVASEADPTKIGSTVITLTAPELSRDDLVLHYIFDMDESGPNNNFVRDYSQSGYDAEIQGAITEDQWDENGFNFIRANANWIPVVPTEEPNAGGLVNQKMTLIIRAERTGALSGSMDLANGKTGWASNGFWTNMSGSLAVFHNGTSNAGSWGANFNAVWPEVGTTVELAYSIDASRVTGNNVGFVAHNGEVNPSGGISSDPLTPVSAPFFIGKNTWANSEYPNNLRLSKYMIFNRNLTREEVYAVYDGYLDTQQPVNFSAGSNGTLTATVDDVSIESGAMVEVGKDVVFTATPSSGYRVAQWRVNGNVVSGNTSNTFTLTNLTAAATVEVSFQPIPSGGGVGGFRPSTSGRVSGAPASTTEEPDDDRDLTVSDGKGTMSAEDVSKAVAEAFEDEDATVIVITLPEGVGSATFDVDDIKLIQERGLDLAVEKDGVLVVIPNVNLVAYVPEDAKEVVILITSVDDKTITDLLGELDNPDSLLRIFNVQFLVDGVSITTFVHKPLMISVPNSMLGLESSDDATGFRLNSNLSCSFFGGVLNTGNDRFEFYTDRLSTYGVMKDIKINRLSFVIGQKSYSINGASRTSDVAPFIDEDARTLVPLRVIAEALGAKVDWDEAAFTATLELEGRTISIRPDVIVSNRTMVPMRYISENLGANVVWDGSTKGIAIYK